ncbi:MAG: hypothetical protein Q8P49_02975 [Candidatus Liptonbacteria bacterium]|nr:hypothetical protein [Candidatus Liptonbacteria bacterium]
MAEVGGRCACGREILQDESCKNALFLFCPYCGNSLAGQGIYFLEQYAAWEEKEQRKSAQRAEENARQKNKKDYFFKIFWRGAIVMVGVLAGALSTVFNKISAQGIDGLLALGLAFLLWAAAMIILVFCANRRAKKKFPRSVSA